MLVGWIILAYSFHTFISCLGRPTDTSSKISGHQFLSIKDTPEKVLFNPCYFLSFKFIFQDQYFRNPLHCRQSELPNLGTPTIKYKTFLFRVIKEKKDTSLRRTTDSTYGHKREKSL